MRRLFPGLGAIIALLLACGDSTSSTGSTTTGTTTTSADTLPDAYKHFTNGVKVSIDGDQVVLSTTDIPDHKSVYFPMSDTMYQAYNGTNTAFAAAPNTITAQQMVFRIPLHPVAASSHAATPLGPIGIAINGVALFNQYNGQDRPLTVEINSFDQGNGHPQQTGVYHYHVEPLHITATDGRDALIGFLLDGFPVYGPVENGRTIADADLDTYHGHFGVTRDYPLGIYHYHITAEDPYINGSGFWGSAGTVSQ
jgi:hypothetical protein